MGTLYSSSTSFAQVRIGPGNKGLVKDPKSNVQVRLIGLLSPDSIKSLKSHQTIGGQVQDHPIVTLIVTNGVNAIIEGVLTANPEFARKELEEIWIPQTIYFYIKDNAFIVIFGFNLKKKVFVTPNLFEIQESLINNSFQKQSVKGVEYKISDCYAITTVSNYNCSTHFNTLKEAEVLDTNPIFNIINQNIISNYIGLDLPGASVDVERQQELENSRKEILAANLAIDASKKEIQELKDALAKAAKAAVDSATGGADPKP